MAQVYWVSVLREFSHKVLNKHAILKYLLKENKSEYLSGFMPRFPSKAVAQNIPPAVPAFFHDIVS